MTFISKINLKKKSEKNLSNFKKYLNEKHTQQPHKLEASFLKLKDYLRINLKSCFLLNNVFVSNYLLYIFLSI